MFSSPKPRRYLHQLIRSLLPFPQGPLAEVRVNPLNRSRRFLLLAHLLAGSGLNLRVHWGWRRFRTLNEKGYQAFSHSRVRLAGLPLARPDLVVVDDANVPRGLPSAAKTLLVSYEARACPDPLPPRTTFVPLLFHPSLMTTQAFETARQFAENSNRSLGVFFAGNLDPAVYDKAVFGREYGMLNRHEVAQIVREDEFRSWVYEPESWEAFEGERTAGRLINRLTLIDVRRFPIPQDRWLELVGQSRYFLAPPGYTQPFCHNLIEALSVGTVPVTGYGHLLRPRLQDLVNCLEFSDAESLRVRLRTLRDGKAGDWLAQSQGARVYQQNHLSPRALEAVFRAFLEEPGSGEWHLILSGALP